MRPRLQTFAPGRFSAHGSGTVGQITNHTVQPTWLRRSDYLSPSAQAAVKLGGSMARLQNPERGCDGVPRARFEKLRTINDPNEERVVGHRRSVAVACSFDQASRTSFDQASRTYGCAPGGGHPGGKIQKVRHQD